nr:hypothetical protein Iba_chr12eCG4320 [Ipomoea batatas]
MDWESRLMETTLPVDLAHSTLVHVQWSLEMDQPEGAGEIAAKSLDMTVASSENERERKLRENTEMEDPFELPDNGLTLGMGASEFWPETGDPPSVLEIRERIEEIRNDAGDSGVARIERYQVCAFCQITRNLPWAESSSRLDILAKDGKGPEREFSWTESDRRDASCVSSEGSSPEMDWESSLMETTLPVELSQLTLVQVHGSLEADQPEGAGESAAKSLDITAASSQNETLRRRECSKGKNNTHIHTAFAYITSSSAAHFEKVLLPFWWFLSAKLGGVDLGTFAKPPLQLFYGFGDICEWVEDSSK